MHIKPPFLPKNKNVTLKMRGTHFRCQMNKKINSLIIFFSYLDYNIFFIRNKAPKNIFLQELFKSDIIKHYVAKR